MIPNTKENYSLRRIIPSKWEDYRSIRLAALQTNPDMFGSNYLKEAAYSQEDWVSFLEHETRAIFGLYHLESLIGLTGVTLKKEDATIALLYASFIKPLYRQKGLSKLFYQARIDWQSRKVAV